MRIAQIERDLQETRADFAARRGAENEACDAEVRAHDVHDDHEDQEQLRHRGAASVHRNGRSARRGPGRAPAPAATPSSDVPGRECLIQQQPQRGEHEHEDR